MHVKHKNKSKASFFSFHKHYSVTPSILWSLEPTNPNVPLQLHYITSIAQQPQLADNNRLKIRKASGVYLSGRKL